LPPAQALIGDAMRDQTPELSRVAPQIGEEPFFVRDSPVSEPFKFLSESADTPRAGVHPEPLNG
jgi:hypothetical protein